MERPCAVSPPLEDTGPAVGWSPLASDDDREHLSPTRLQGHHAGSLKEATAAAVTPRTLAQPVNQGASFPTELL